MEKNGQRENCFVCSTQGKGCCRTEGVNYEIVCVECSCTCYNGETAGNAFSRGKQHLDDLYHSRAVSRMKQHADQKHDGRVPDFKMNITGVYGNDAMSRQIGEAIRIRRAPPGQLVNSKEEWNFLQLPNVVLE